MLAAHRGSDVYTIKGSRGNRTGTNWYRQCIGHSASRTALQSATTFRVRRLNILSSRGALTAAALATLVNIRTLELRLQSARYIPILEKSSFPRLYKFASSMPFTSEVIVFINRHPAIRDLALLPQFITVKPPLQPVKLPNLKHVRTISETLPTVLAASPNVELVFLQHSSATPNLNQVAEEIDAIAKLAPNLRALQVTRPVLSLEVTLLISTRLSKLETLAIYRPRPRSSFDVEYEVDALPRMGEYLSAFQSLSYLRMQYSSNCHRNLTLADLDHDCSMVSAWGAACPTLTTCVLPTEISWFRSEANVWLPEQESPLCQEWAAEKLWNSDYDSLNQLLQECQCQLQLQRHFRYEESQDTPTGWQALWDTFGATFGPAWIQMLVMTWSGIRSKEAATQNGAGHLLMQMQRQRRGHTIWGP